ncbi:MAG: Hsp20/alpha crystallin family protein [Thermomicrobiales bacterium]|nr:Hsp20/alpha crystallin family protein [Thermomicrobiales bacterium]
MIVVRRSRPHDPERVQQEMEAVFRTLMTPRPAMNQGQSARWRPAIEVFETNDALVVCAEIAGMDEERLNVAIEGDVLSIRGERPDPTSADRRAYHEARIPYGAFGADVYIPFPIEPEDAGAEYRDGFLRIVLPRAVARTIVPRQVDAEARRNEGTG